jgi:integrase
MQLLSIRYWYTAGQPDDYVFPGRYRNTPLSQNNKSYEIIWKDSKNHFMLHDLRRTFLTVADALDLTVWTIKRLANHSSSGDVTEGYIVKNPERLREPMERIEKTLMILCGAEMRF